MPLKLTEFAVTAVIRFRNGSSLAEITDGHRPKPQVFWGGGIPGAGELVKILDNAA